MTGVGCLILEKTEGVYLPVVAVAGSNTRSDGYHETSFLTVELEDTVFSDWVRMSEVVEELLL